MKGSHKIGILVSAVSIVTVLVIVVIVTTPPPFINSDPVLNVPVSSPINKNTNQMVTFTVTAMDPDEAIGQTVTLSALGGSSGRNPFTFGATFNPSTGVFSFRAVMLGMYSVRFQASDDYTPAGTDFEEVTIIVSPAPVGINEFRYLGLGAQDIELHNINSSSVSIDGWVMSVNPTANYVFPGVTIPGDGYIVLHWNQSGSDTGTDFFTGLSPTLTNLEDEGTLVLYSSNNLTVTDIVDGVSWNSTGAHLLIDDLVTSGHWPSNNLSDAIDISSYSAGYSFAYTGTGENNTSWVLDTTPTFGSDNS